MSTTDKNNNIAKSQFKEKYFYGNQGDDSIPDHIDMADYSGKDAKSHLHLLTVIEAQKIIWGRRESL